MSRMKIDYRTAIFNVLFHWSVRHVTISFVSASDWLETVSARIGQGPLQEPSQCVTCAAVNYRPRVFLDAREKSTHEWRQRKRPS